MLNRRGLITGLISLVAAPAIVRASSLMPVKVYREIDLLNLPVYGRSPAMDALPDMAEINWRVHWKILRRNMAAEDGLACLMLIGTKSGKGLFGRLWRL